jgi:histidine ammonia-lyase
MAAHAARRLQKINANLNMILGIELACAVQGVSFRAPLKTSPMLQDVIAGFRTKIMPLDQDRFMAPDLQLAAVMIADGSLVKGLDMPAYILGQSTA